MRDETHSTSRPSPAESIAAMRATILRRLPAAGFLPPPEYRLILRRLRGGASVLDAGAVEYGLRPEVEEFAAAYWQLSPAARRARWAELLAACAEDPALTYRLRHLERGLDLDAVPADPDAPRVRQIEGLVQELYVLPSAVRAARRRERVEQLAEPMRAWATALHQLRKQSPAVAALDPPLLDRLAVLTRRAQRRPTAVEAAHRPSWEFSARWAVLGVLLFSLLLRLSIGAVHPPTARVVAAPPRLDALPPWGPARPPWGPIGSPTTEEFIKTLRSLPPSPEAKLPLPAHPLPVWPHVIDWLPPDANRLPVLPLVERMPPRGGPP